MKTPKPKDMVEIMNGPHECDNQLLLTATGEYERREAMMFLLASKGDGE